MAETNPSPEKGAAAPAKTVPQPVLRPAAVGALKLEGTAIKQRFQDAAGNAALLNALHRQYDQRLEHIIARLPENDAIPEPPAPPEEPRRIATPAPAKVEPGPISDVPARQAAGKPAEPPPPAKSPP